MTRIDIYAKIYKKHYNLYLQTSPNIDEHTKELARRESHLEAMCNTEAEYQVYIRNKRK
jgi:hypothetical protein